MEQQAGVGHLSTGRHGTVRQLAAAGRFGACPEARQSYRNTFSSGQNGMIF